MYVWVIDTDVTPPNVDVIAPVNGSKIVHGEIKDEDQDDTMIVGWADVVATASDALSGVDTVVFQVDGVPVPPIEVIHDPVANTWTFEFEPVVQGEQVYLIEAIATDKATNSATSSITIIGVATGKKH